jgi:hypothetical protein
MYEMPGRTHLGREASSPSFVLPTLELTPPTIPPCAAAARSRARVHKAPVFMRSTGVLVDLSTATAVT